MTEKRSIVNGARCTWWDSIDKASFLPGGLPCCPKCRGVLFETPSIEVWQKNVDDYNEHSPGYRGLIAWLRGKCFPTMGDAQQAMMKEKKMKDPEEIANNTWRKGFFHLVVDGDGLVSLWDREHDASLVSYVKFPLTKEQMELLEEIKKKDGPTV